jgi:hypothetical protein
MYTHYSKKMLISLASQLYAQRPVEEPAHREFYYSLAQLTLRGQRLSLRDRG